MSRIGKQPIQIPEGVALTKEGGQLLVKGPKGEQHVPLFDGFTINQSPESITFIPVDDASDHAKFWGLQRTLVANAIHGITQGFEKKLIVSGVGFRVALQGRKLVLNLGFSHPVEYEAPEGIDLQVEGTNITIQGINKQLVGSTAAAIRSFKKPEPYKGKGIAYSDERIRRKAGKTAAKTAG